ncbi:2-phosphosulfolactate phosphatase [Rhodococcus sp. NPDC003318]|uniref:2-phosphosulfolactate phosphatase n=1 Tax=Rhodococcus sp. NPDC003318 TaxID=3364503 RepID=UPI0036C1FCDC
MTSPPSVDPAHSQDAYRFRFDWGREGAAAVVPGCDVAVVVDVLSFTTTLTVAIDAGAAVYPYPWDPEAAADHAARLDATLAVGRSKAGPGQPSLSPASIRAAGTLERLVLPSPNGSALSFALAEAGVAVVGACLRNASAVARWIVARAGGPVAVIAAGERWPDGTLRPAAEDLWGAGAVLGALAAADPAGASPEALTAAAAFAAVAPSIGGRLRDCASGRELVAKGFAGDVEVSAELDTTTTVPLLRGLAFEDAPTRGEDR